MKFLACKNRKLEAEFWNAKLEQIGDMKTSRTQYGGHATEMSVCGQQQISSDRYVQDFSVCGCQKIQGGRGEIPHSYKWLNHCMYCYTNIPDLQIPK